MSKVLVVGNVIKDIYLRVDERSENFEEDEEGVDWVDLAFDGRGYNYLQRSSIFGGATITKDILTKFGVEAEIATYASGADAYRYIFCKGDGLFYLVPEERPRTEFKAPGEIANWIFVDRSAEISAELVEKIKSYLALSGRTRLAVFISSKEGRNWTNAEKELVSFANLIFADGELPLEPRGLICRIEPENIVIGEERRYWRASKVDCLTHLSAYSIIAGSVLGSLLRGRSAGEALDFAKANVENATLSGTLEYSELEAKVRKMEKRREDLRLIAKTLVLPGKGILAADESGGSIHKKFLEAGIPDDFNHRRDYRDIFFTTEGLSNYVNGVILFDETARQLSDDGRDYVSYLTSLGIVPGIKVDQGLEPFGSSEVSDDFTEVEEGRAALPTDTWTKGLGGIHERLHEYYEMGLRFAKWRAAFRIDASRYAIKRNAAILAEYAKACQEEGLVPIVEPELMYDGDYNIHDSEVVTSKILDVVFSRLTRANVDLSACLLKVNMVIGGKQRELSSSAEVGEYTARVLREHVPESLAGVVFLSGGQGVEQATENLRAVIENGPFPWSVTFSFARALQAPALEAWGGDNARKEEAREAFRERLVANTEALKAFGK